MKWGVNEAERSGGWFQRAMVEPKGGFFTFRGCTNGQGQHHRPGKEQKKIEGHCARPKGSNTMVEVG